jgi:hypothetical protein
MPGSRSFTRKKTGASKPPNKPFRELFSRDELCYYGIAAVVYIILGLLFQGLVLNWVAGPLFIVAWMWWVPPFIEKRRGQ